MARLTSKGVEAIKPVAARQEIPDVVVPGLYLVVQPSGSKSWAVRYRLDGRPRKFTLGTYPRVELAEAREAARAALALVAKGVDPAHHRETARRTEAEQRANTFRAVAEAFIEKYAKAHQPRSWSETEATFKRHLFPAWGDRPFTSIRRRDLHAILDGLDAAGKPGAKAHVVAAVSRLFGWAVDREIVEASPFVRLRRPKVGRRERTLTDDEIWTLWRACDAQGYPFGRYVQLLLLTGCRRTELARLTKSEIDPDRHLIVLASARFKTGKPHVVPLSALGQEILEGLPEFRDSEYVFSTRGGSTPIAGFSKRKQRLDARLSPTFDYDLHDLRRTVRTGLSKLRIARHVAERVLGHVPQGVETHYDHWEYLEEKREALEAWGRYVERLIRPVESNVVPLIMAAP
jgi:integrase